jgi:hypothetical protein
MGHIGESSVSVVVVQRVLPVVGHKQIVVTVVVVVADTACLSPTCADVEAGTFGDVGEGAVPIVLEQAAVRFLSLRETFEAPAVDQKNVEPAVVVVIVEGEAAAGGLEQIFILADGAVGRYDVQSGSLHDIHKADTEWRPFDWGFRSRRRRSGLGVVAALHGSFLLVLGSILLLRKSRRHEIGKGKHQSCATQRAKKLSAIER